MRPARPQGHRARPEAPSGRPDTKALRSWVSSGAREPPRRVFWDGSRSRVLAALLRDEEWSEEELDALKAAVEQAARTKREKNEKESS